MGWVAATTYRARIGGILYRNVRCPVAVNDERLVSINRDSESHQLGVTFELRREDGERIASVCNNEIILHGANDFELLGGRARKAILERGSGRVWCEIATPPSDPDCELELSCLLFSQSGYPVLLHPDRSKFGKANDNQPPNLAFLTLTTAPGSMAAAVGLENASLYLLGIAIENFDVGVRITHTRPDETK